MSDHGYVRSVTESEVRFTESVSLGLVSVLFWFGFEFETKKKCVL